jgi:hypothetical protein
VTQQCGRHPNLDLQQTAIGARCGASLAPKHGASVLETYSRYNDVSLWLLVFTSAHRPLACTFLRNRSDSLKKNHSTHMNTQCMLHQGRAVAAGACQPSQSEGTTHVGG